MAGGGFDVPGSGGGLPKQKKNKKSKRNGGRIYIHPKGGVDLVLFSFFFFYTNFDTHHILQHIFTK